MRIAGVLIGLAACNSGKGNGNAPPGEQPATITPKGARLPPPKKGVSGEIHLSGALAGTFTWKDDLAIDTCGWVADTHVGGLGATMSDGKDTFISLTALVDSGTTKITLTSGKLKLPHAGFMSGSSGAELSGTQAGDNSTISVTYKNATVTADGQTVTIDGSLSGNCTYSP